MTEEQIVAAIRKKRDASGKKHDDFAREDVGVSGGFLYDVLAGRRAPGDKVREYLGIERVVGYKKKEAEKK